MASYKPGEVVIVPTEGGADHVKALLAETDRGSLDILYSVEDVLRYYHLDIEGIHHRFKAFPFVARVPEGEELEYAQNYRMFSEIRVALPNFYIYPLTNELQMNTEFVSQALDVINCRERSPHCGKDVTIAVLDTGVEPDALEHPESLYKEQYATDQALDPSRGTSPFDLIGHGSTVAYIINKIVPAATIFSVKMMEENGTIGGFLSAVYLAEAKVAPDIYNLSFGLSRDPEKCYVCGHSSGEINIQQFRLLFESIDNMRPNTSHCKPLLVAAAGNGGDTISMPAIFPNVLAVGSYDLVTEEISTDSPYERVPEERYILAPGGQKTPQHCVAQKPYPGWYREATHCFSGTSFAAAFVTGTAARYLCQVNDSPDRGEQMEAGREYLLQCLKESTLTSISEYMPRTHGMGLVYYQWKMTKRCASPTYRLKPWERLVKQFGDKRLPQEVLPVLQPFQGTEFVTQEDFLQTIEKRIGVQQLVDYQARIVQQALCIQLRSTPLTVSSKEARESFQIDEHLRPLEYIQNDYEDQGKVVLDHATGLMWQKSGSEKTMFYENAQRYIEKLNRQKLAGHDDWRLPTIPELISLLDPEKNANGLFINPIFGATQRWVFSADLGQIYKKRAKRAWYVTFSYGNVYLDHCVIGTYVRAVRS